MNTVLERRTLGRRYYPETVIQMILERVAEGIPVLQIFEDQALPCRASFYSWCAADADLRSRFDAAMASARRKTATQRDQDHGN